MQYLCQIEIKLNARGFSINDAYYRRGNRTVNYRKWTDDIHRQISSLGCIERFKKVFDKKEHFLTVDIVRYIPESLFYNKDGSIKINTLDLSNTEKTIIDVIFDKKYQDRQLKTGGTIKTLECDDKAICKLTSVKLPHTSKEYVTSFVVTIYELSHLQKLLEA